MKLLSVTLFKSVLIFCLCFFTGIVFAQHPAADALVAKGEEWFRAGRYDSAAICLEKAGKLYRKKNAEKYVEVMNRAGVAMMQKGDSKAALTLLQQLKPEALKLSGSAQVHLAQWYNNIGAAYRQQKDYNRAIEYHQQALQLFLQLFGEKHDKTADSYTHLGIDADLKGNLDQALIYYQKALTIRKELKSNNLANSYINLANLYRKKGIYPQALRYNEQALALQPTMHHPRVANIYNNLGNLSLNLHSYDQALDYFQKAIALYKEFLSEKHESLSIAYGNLGHCYLHKQNYDLSLYWHKEALKINLEIYGEQDLEVANNYTNIGAAYGWRQQYEEAIGYYEKAIEIVHNNEGGRHPMIATNYINIGTIWHIRKQYHKAIEFFQKALAIEQSVYGKLHPSISKAYQHIGAVYNATYRYRDMARYMHYALMANDRYFTDSTLTAVPGLQSYYSAEEFFHSLTEKAAALEKIVIHEKPKQWMELLRVAYRHVEVADTLMEQTRSSYVSKTDQMDFLHRATTLTEQAIRLCKRLYAATEDSVYMERALYFAEKNKANILRSSLFEETAKKEAQIPDSLLAIEENLTAEITFYQEQLSSRPDSAEEVQYRNRLFDLKRAHEKLTKRFETEYPEFAKLKYLQISYTARDFRVAMEPNTAIIEYFVGDSSVYLFTVTHDDLIMKELPKPVDFEANIIALRSSIVYGVQSLYTRLAYQIYKDYFPHHLPAHITKLIVVPDSRLGNMPFEALLTEPTSERRPYQKYPFLIKKYEVSYAYSATLFYELFGKKIRFSGANGEADNDFLAYAPVFTHTNEALTLKSGAIDKKKAEPLATRSPDHEQTVSALPMTETEVREIFKLFDREHMKAKAYLHHQASEENVKGEDLQNYKYLHFATHGMVNQQIPEMSGLVLDQDTTGKEDGMLYAGEISNLKLNAELVVLSACETGLGKIARGEGVIGLTRSLLYAGARNVLVSLWKVADESSGQLMIDFYKNMLAVSPVTRNQDFALALRKAKLKMIAQGKYAFPYYWSPFILVGQ